MTESGGGREVRRDPLRPPVPGRVQLAAEYRAGVVGPVARPCSVCSSAEIEAIDAAIRDGRSQRSVSVQWSVSRSALGRHVAAGHGLAEVVDDLDGAWALAVGSVDARARALLDECGAGGARC